MLAFLDTEFTDLVIRPRLLSAAITPSESSGQEFYAEVTDLDRVRATNWYGLDAVLPQFGKVAHAACTYATLGVRLSTFLSDWVSELHAGETLDLAHGYFLDWDLIDLAIRDSGSPAWELTRRRIRPVNVFGLTGSAAGRSAAEAYFKRQALAPFSRHHALCDARALRVAYQAAAQAAAERRPCAAVSRPAAHDQTAAA